MPKWIITVMSVVLVISITGIMLETESTLSDFSIISSGFQKLGDIVLDCLISGSLPEFNPL